MIIAGVLTAAEPTVQPNGTILNPRFEKTPKAWQFANAVEGLPSWVRQQNVHGQVVVTCGVLADGSMDACSVIEESPQGAGFGQAALKLAKLFRMAPTLANGQSVGGGKVRIPLGFGMPAPSR